MKKLVAMMVLVVLALTIGMATAENDVPVSEAVEVTVEITDQSWFDEWKAPVTAIYTFTDEGCSLNNFGIVVYDCDGNLVYESTDEILPEYVYGNMYECSEGLVKDIIESYHDAIGYFKVNFK